MRAIRIGVVVCAAIMAVVMASAARAGERRPPVLVATEIRLEPDGDAEVAIKAGDEMARRYGLERLRVDPARILEDTLELGPSVRVDRISVIKDEAERTVTLQARVAGVAGWRGERYEITLPNEAAMVHGEGELIVSVHSRREPGRPAVTFVNRYHLPPGGSVEQYDLDSGVLSCRVPGGRRPGGRFHGGDLSGHWELGLGRNQPFPPGVSTMFMDLSPDGRGGYGGSVVLQQGGPGNNAITMSIREWRQAGDKVLIKAAFQMREGRRTLDVVFDFDGELERGGAMRGKAKVLNHLSGDAPRATEMDLTFYRSR